MQAPSAKRLEPMDLPAGTRLGGWRIIGRLGWGGYGVVYLVRSVRRPWFRAALKLALHLGVARRLKQERELLARVRHPHVVRPFDSGDWLPPGEREPLPFFVMEYVPGAHLYTFAWQSNPRLREMLEHCRDSALALHAVHEAGAVHRDVKGENLLVSRSGRLLLVDFGVGRYEGAKTLTETPLPPGTRLYRSPEALRFQRAHSGDFEVRYDFRPADDLYALGVTWYRALTDAFPFEEDEDSEKARREGRLPAAPCKLNPRVPSAVSELLLRLLASEPESRPASAREVAETLDALLRGGGGELEAHLFEWDDWDDVPSPRRRPRPHGPSLPVVGLLLREWLKRHRAALGVAAAVAGLIAGLWLHSRDTTKEGDAMQDSKRSALFSKTLQSLLCLVTTAGCASVPTAPTWPRDCPSEALAAMREAGFGPGDWSYIQFDINQQGGASERGVHREGPIVSIFTTKDATRLLPVGTKLYGYLWMGGKEFIHVHWNRAELPDGRQMPVCARLSSNRDRAGYHREEGPEPGTVLVPRQAPLFITARFERPE